MGWKAEVKARYKFGGGEGGGERRGKEAKTQGKTEKKIPFEILQHMGQFLGRLPISIPHRLQLFHKVLSIQLNTYSKASLYSHEKQAKKFCFDE